MANFPGPYEIELKYTCSGEQHVQRLNCDVVGSPTPGTDPTTIDMNLRSGSTIKVDAGVNAWTLLIDALFHTSVTFDDYTLWSYAPLTFDRTFIATATIGTNGVNAGAVNLSFQQILTFRTLEGGVMKLNFMESSATSIARLTYAASGPAVVAIFDFVNGTTNWILARDTSYPIAAIHSMGGENEALFKKRNR